MSGWEGAPSARGHREPDGQREPRLPGGEVGRWLGQPYYPFLLVAFSVFALYAANLGEMFGGEAAPPLAGMLALAGAGFVLCAWLLRDRHKAALVCFVGLVGLIYFGDLLEGLRGALGPDVPGAALLAATAALVLILLLWLRRARRSFAAVTLTLNAAIAAPLAATLLSIAHFNLTSPYPQALSAVHEAVKEKAATVDPQQAAAGPSIFYLIFDRYGSRGVLRDQYDYDNGPFLEELRRRGFYVAEESFSNYPTTPLSLASSLNFTHLLELAQAMGPDSDDRRPYFRLIQDSAVARVLREAGYRYHSVGSYWEPTRLIPASDEAHGFDRVPDFTRVYLRKTALRVLARIHDPGLFRDVNCRRVNHQFDKLDELATQRDRNFVFGHLLIPHPPYTFARDGRCTSEAEERARTTDENYLEQLRYTNARILQFIDRVLAAPGPKPIVILQADEGPYPERMELSRIFDWRTADDAEVKRKFGILNSFYFPDGDYSELYVGITPVNTFRVILRKFYDIELELLPDESYVYVASGRPYDFFPVTWRLRKG